MTLAPARAAARAIARRRGTRDPFRICREEGITVMARNDFKRQKGAFTVVAGERFIFINGLLSEEMQRIVCAHELGHAVLHRREGRNVFPEFDLFSASSGRLEGEANAFAAELLLDGEEILQLAREGMDAAQIARATRSHVNLVILKMEGMNARGGGFRLPRGVRSGFLLNAADDAGEV